MKKLIMLCILVFSATQYLEASTVSVDVGTGSLIYSDGSDGKYNSLVFKTHGGDILRVFDEGLKFIYDSNIDVENLSPDKTYSIVHFTESGALGGDDGIADTHTMYLCAFVRMKDGCVLSVATGVQCDGEWRGEKKWSSTLDRNERHFFEGSVSADKVYAGYALGRKDFTQTSSPRILAYLLEGTTVENLLACDPPRKSNRATYSKLINQLQVDGDENNYKILKDAIDNVGQSSALSVEN
jgi:hypothetical protein